MNAQIRADAMFGMNRNLPRSSGFIAMLGIALATMPATVTADETRGPQAARQPVRLREGLKSQITHAAPSGRVPLAACQPVRAGEGVTHQLPHASQNAPFSLTAADLADTDVDPAADSRPADTTNFLGLDAAPLTEPLVTDRPDFTEATNTVPRGHLQLEMGYTFTYDKEDGNRTIDHTLPEFLLRTGLTDWLELRIGWAGWSSTEDVFRAKNDAGRTVTMTEVERGWNDLYLGFKIALCEQDGLRPALSLIPAITVPSGSSNKSSGDVDPENKIAWSYDLTDSSTLSGNLNFAVPTDGNGHRFFQTAASISLGHSFNDWLGGYVEYYGFYPNEPGSDCAHTINGGFTFLVNDNLQFDVRVGKGLNEEADDMFAGAGMAIRY